MAALRGLRMAAVAEAATLLLLIGIAVPLKHLAGMPEATAVMGPVHGASFLAFLWLVARTCAAGELPWRAAGRLLLGAMLPFGGLVNERWLARRAARDTPMMMTR